MKTATSRRLERAHAANDFAHASTFEDFSRAQLAIVERLVPRCTLPNKHMRSEEPRRPNRP